MDCQINSCFEEIERMQYSDNIEKEFRVLKSQKIHCYKFGDKSVLKKLKECNIQIILKKNLEY